MNITYGSYAKDWTPMRLKAAVALCTNGIWGAEPDGGDLDMVCVRVADFDRQRLRIDPSSYTRRKIDLPKDDRRIIRNGDLIIEKSGGGEKQLVGAVALYDRDEPVVCSNFCARIKVKPGVDSRYLNFVFSSLYDGRLNYSAIKQTTGIQNLDSEEYFQEKLRFPPTPQQTRIADFLDHETARIDELIAKEERLLKLLDEKCTALISHAVTKGLDPNAELKDSGVEWFGKIPKGWEVKKLKYVFRFLDFKRRPISSAIRGELAKEYPYYGASGIIDYVDDYIFDEPLILVAEDGANLFSRSSPLAFMATGKYWVNNHAHILKPLDGMVSYWSAVLAQIVYDPWISGSAQPKLTGESLGTIPLSFPPSDERVAIEQYLNAQSARFDTLKTKINEAINLLHEKRTALISAAVTGKITI